MCLALSIVSVHAASPSPIPGTWRFVGTTPPGFTRQGTQVARLTLSYQHRILRAVVVTGVHRYVTTGQYSALRHELLLIVRTTKGTVRLQATLWTGEQRMIGTWSDTRGDDGGFVLVRAN